MSCHDVSFVAICSTGVIITTASVGACDDKAGLMTKLNDAGFVVGSGKADVKYCKGVIVSATFVNSTCKTMAKIKDLNNKANLRDLKAATGL